MGQFSPRSSGDLNSNVDPAPLAIALTAAAGAAIGGPAGAAIGAAIGSAIAKIFSSKKRK